LNPILGGPKQSAQTVWGKERTFVAEMADTSCVFVSSPHKGSFAVPPRAPNKKDIQSDVLFCLVEIKDGFEDLSAVRVSAAREGSTERNIYRFFSLREETM
jgi:hypothetical protein